MGTVSSARLVIDPVEELYDYEKLRRSDVATMFVLRVPSITLVLGGNQPREILDDEVVASMRVLRRRGGGGLVVLQPGDVWIDWWIPANDPRWHADVRVSSITAGRWWREPLVRRIEDEPVVHEGALEGEPALRVVCFAGRGPGEVFVDGRKAVGLTQWRVREGVFVSSVLHAQSSQLAQRVLREPPEGLGGALEHHTLASLGIRDVERLVDDVAAAAGTWSRRVR